ncbi:MAG: hypothetical protein HS117_26385 [Verrucomicrobiaceae bacterium]|jgi:hypothetical protein|nr:hypothetical protein [Verrucomicrobiaceae bacterium]
MRGSPPIQLFLLAIAFVVLAIPLAHLTGNAPVEAPKAAKATAKPKEAKSLLRVRFVHKPEKLSLKLGERELLENGDWMDNAVEFEATLPLSLDLLVAADWAYGAPDQALTIEIEPDGQDRRSDTRWSAAGSLNEVYSFQW